MVVARPAEAGRRLDPDLLRATFLDRALDAAARYLGDLVLLLQSTRFQLDVFRIRIELFTESKGLERMCGVHLSLGLRVPRSVLTRGSAPRERYDACGSGFLCPTSPSAGEASLRS